jgi:hypothetical protein
MRVPRYCQHDVYIMVGYSIFVSLLIALASMVVTFP